MTAINDSDVQRIIDAANRGATPADAGPAIDDPPDTVFTLCAGYTQDDGRWSREFEVRELTGRDEEALARMSGVGRILTAMMERGTVRLGSDPATPERLDSLVAGDWDTILVAIRIVTFGPEVEINPTCFGCQRKYEVTVDLSRNIETRNASFEELSWSVTTRNHTYDMVAYTGETQRRLYEVMAEDPSTPLVVLNTEALRGSIVKIDNFPVMGKDEIRDLSMSDRRTLLQSLESHRVGPRLGGVMIKCPTCGHEQNYSLSVAALFQWN